MSRRDIIQELNELSSSLGDGTPENPYAVPQGYFENLASAIVQKISGSPFLTKENPYSVPVGYFGSFPEQMMDKIRNHPDYLTSQEELEMISPLLNNLKKEPVYSVPEDYFGNFKVEVNHQPAVLGKKPAKVVGMFSKKITRYAVAAIITALVVTTTFVLLNRNTKTPEEKIISKVENDVNKIKNMEQLNTLTEFMDADLNEAAVASRNKMKTDDVEKLLKDVSLDELKDFSEESKDMQDVMVMN
jgi:hypothetical protein